MAFRVLASGRGASWPTFAVTRGLASATRPVLAPMTAGGRASAVERAPAAAKDGGKGAAANATRARKDKDLRQDDTKYRQMLSVLYPKDDRPAKSNVDAAELDRRAVVAKLWSRYAVRQEHEHRKEIDRFIKARQHARQRLLALYPEAVAAGDAQNAADSEKPFPTERRIPTDTPTLPSTASR